MGITKRVSPKAMRRSFQDAMREAQAANVVVRSISGHLTEQMQQRYSTYFFPLFSCRRERFRTSDPYRVKVVLYH